MPAGTVKVDRSTKFGNPWGVRETLASELFEPSQVGQVCFDCYKSWLSDFGEQVVKFPIYAKLAERRRVILESLHELRGKDLACWCGLGDLCHADVLLELANR